MQSRIAGDRHASTLILPNVKVSDAGFVRCNLVDAGGRAIGFATARLKVVPKGLFNALFLRFLYVVSQYQ